MTFDDIAIIEDDYTNLDSVRMPQLVYKYRSWNNGDRFHDNVLVRNELFMAYPDSFTDKSDSRNIPRLDLMNDEEIKRWAENMLKNVRPDWDDKTLAREHARRVPNLMRDFRNEESMKKFTDYEWNNYNKQTGILSLCMQSLNNKMWDMYANKHMGICYGLDTNKFIRMCGSSGGNYVTYKKELPHINPFDDKVVNSLMRIYFKHENWRFEEEYRITTSYENNPDQSRILVVPDSVFREVILGKSFDERQIPTVIAHLKAKEFRPILYKCKVRDNILIRELIQY